MLLFAPKRPFGPIGLSVMIVFSLVVLVGPSALIRLFADESTKRDLVFVLGLPVVSLVALAGVWWATFIPQTEESRQGPSFLFDRAAQVVTLPREGVSFPVSRAIRFEAVEVAFPGIDGPIRERQLVLGVASDDAQSPNYHVLCARSWHAPKLAALLSSETGIPAVFVRAALDQTGRAAP